MHVGAQVKKLAAPRIGGDGVGSIDDHVSVVTGAGGQEGNAERAGVQDVPGDGVTS